MIDPWGDFVGQYLTIQNTYGLGAKAVALRVSGDRATFFGCRILSYQDTLLDDTRRHYYNNCYIEGAVDFIFGNATSLFEMSNVILPQGWDDWGNSSKQSTVFYREYKCYGPGANNRKMVEWSKQLMAKEADIFLTKNMIGGKSWVRSTPKHFKKASSTISNNSTTH
ncbi:hypothetical protein PVK06_016295 [Gossypium arboreum]|uniref:Pectinesterase n=1 Tax=Gossypium arboreum TaxID=29729 RepID=A0ABR0Q0Q2_GOSAR|nr:hypothetical protein PVK06_016295 [Gossypium arboreum]